MLRGATEAERRGLLAAFAPYVIDEHATRPANYSLRLSHDPKVFHTLHRGSCLVVGSPDTRRVLAALVRHVEAHAPTVDGTVAVQALAVVEAGGVTLVPTLVQDDLRALGRRLQRAGATLLDAPYVRLDLDAREVVVAPNLDVDHGALAELGLAAPPARRADPPAADGRYPVRRWLFMDYWQPPGPYSRATATRRAALLVRGGPAGAGADVLRRFGDLFADVAAEGIDPSSTQETLGLLAAAG